MIETNWKLIIYNFKKNSYKAEVLNVFKRCDL